MAIAMGEYSNNGAVVALVAGVPGKLLRVRRIVFFAGTSGNLRGQSDPGGAESTNLTPRLFTPANRGFDVALGSAYALTTARGKALGFAAELLMVATYSVMLWYDVVD